jgi:2-C-methyl-D-erythritol 2,4-cyclodiphosphate synthase
MIATGIGYDCHQFALQRPLVLGGVVIESDRGLLGHSDADVLTHAVIDALLGGAGLDDIGTHFPDTDERFRGADSLDLLRSTLALLAARGVRVLHVDATVVTEGPKLAGYRSEIRASLAGVLGLSVEHVNVKATRGEGMGWIGRGEGAACVAIATVEWGHPRSVPAPPAPPEPHESDRGRPRRFRRR